MQLKKLKYGVGVLPLGFMVLALATSGQGVSPSAVHEENSTPVVNVETTQNEVAAPANVTVNGQHVDVPENGTATVRAGDTAATVSGSSSNAETKPEKTTTVKDDNNGNVSVSVNESSSNKSGSSFTNVTSFSSSSSGGTSNSSVQVSTNGTGNVTVSD